MVLGRCSSMLCCWLPFFYFSSFYFLMEETKYNVY